MILGRIGEIISDGFSVTTSSNVLVPGIDSTAFTYHLFDPDNNEVGSTIGVNITELGYGHYRSSFVSNKTGVWILSIYHSTYFPWGKTGSFEIYTSDFNTIAVNLARMLGLMQENYYLDETIYDDANNLTSGRIRIYSDSISVGTDNNVIATYNVESEWNGLTANFCKVIKV